MVVRNRRLTRARARWIYAAAGSALLPGAALCAATYTWTGAAADSNWSSPANWSGAIVPVSGPASDLVFPAGAARLDPNQDIRNNTQVQSLKFGAAKYTMGGLSIAMSGNALVQSDFAATISNDLQLLSNTTFTGTGVTSINGVISDAGSLIKEGTGNLTLANANTYSGTTQINSGQLLITNAAALQTSTVSINVNNGLSPGFLTSATLGNLTGTGSLNLGNTALQIGANNSTAAAYTGTITSTGAGSLEKIGAGILTLGGANSSFSSVTVRPGLLVLDGGSMTLTSTAHSVELVGSMTVRNGAQLDTRAGTGAIGSFLGTTPVMTITGAGTRWRAGLITVGGGLGSLIVDAGATITDATTITVGKVAGGSFTPTPATLLIQGQGSVVADTAKLGTNPETFGQATVSGIGSLWTINSSLVLGRLALSGADGPGHGQVMVNDGGAVTVNGITNFITDTSSIDVNSGTFSTASITGTVGAIHLNSASSVLSITGNSGTSSFSGEVSGQGNLVKSGGSTFTLDGNFTYTGTTTVNGGILHLPSGGGSHTFTVNGGILEVAYNDLGTRSFRANPGGTVLYQNSAISGGFLRGSGYHNLAAVSRLEGTTLGSDASINQASAITMINVTNAGTINSNAALTIDGFSLTSAGKLNFNNQATVEAFESSGQISISAEATVNNIGNDLVLGAGSRTFIGQAKDQGGTLILRDQTSLQLNGALLVNNGTIDGPTSVNFGSLAKGAGRFGEVIVTDGGKFSPGNSPGAVTTGSTTWNSGGGYLVEVGASIHDFWQVSGQLNLQSSAAHPFIVSLASLDDLAFDSSMDYSWPILHAQGGIINFDPAGMALDISQFKSDLGSGRFSLHATGSDLMVNFSAVPEVGTMSALAIAALGTLLRIRRKA